MRLSSVEAVNRHTGDKRVFNFGAGKNTDLVIANNSTVDKYIAFALCGNVHCNDDVNLYFTQDDQDYLLKRSRSGFNTFAQFGKMVDGQFEMMVEGEDVDIMLNELLGGDPQSMVDNDFIDQQMIDNFDGDLSVFKNIDMLVNIINEARTEKQSLLAKRAEVKNNMKQLSSMDSQFSSRKIVDLSNEELRVVNEQIVALTNKANDMKHKLTGSVLSAELGAELKHLTQKYEELIQNKDSVEYQRNILNTIGQVREILPEFDKLAELKSAKEYYEKSEEELQEQITTKEEELKKVDEASLENQTKFDNLVDIRQRLNAVSRDMNNYQRLTAQNKELSERLSRLRAEENALSVDRAELKQRLHETEQNIVDAKEHIDSVAFPNVSVSNLLDLVRLNVMREEVAKHRQQLEAKIQETEKQIAEKEGIYALQIKRFQSVTELDTRMNSIKAKDTIMQVLDAKINKLMLVTNSLVVKKRNLEQSKKEYDEKLQDIEHSKLVLEQELIRVRSCKQEEFKREVYLNNQKLFNQDANNVYAVTTRLEDDQTASLEQEVEKRTVEHESMLEKRYTVEGRINELARQIEMNEAELSVLRQEKSNIEERYEEIIARNRNEDVNNYLQSLQDNTSTQYLLQTQEDTIRNDVEIKRLYSDLESLRSQLAEAKARINHLEVTQQDLEVDSAGTLDKYIGNNDQMLYQLEDMSGRISANFERFKALSQEIAQLEEKIIGVQSSIFELEKTIAINQAQIKEAEENVSKYGNFNEVDKAFASLQIDDTEVRQQKDHLIEQKQSLEKELYETRIEHEKIAFTLDQTTKELDMLTNQIDMELVARNITMQDIEMYKEGGNEQEIREVIETYDTRCKQLEESIASTKRMLEKQPQSDIDDATRRDEELMVVERELDDLNARKQELEQTCQENMEKYVQGNNAKLRYAVLATEASGLGDINKSIQKNDMLAVLADDKLKRILGGVQNYLRMFTGADFELSIEDRQLKIKLGEEIANYKQLKAQLKAQVYISLKLGVPAIADTVATWVLLSEDIKIPQETLQEMMSKVREYDHIIG